MSGGAKQNGRAIFRTHGGKTGDWFNAYKSIHTAVRVGHKEIAELLIANGAEVNAKDERGWTPLHYAATKEVAELLIAESANVNAKRDDGYTPLHAAVVGLQGWGEDGDQGWEIFELLIENGAEVNAKIETGKLKGRTPLDMAVDAAPSGIESRGGITNSYANTVAKRVTNWKLKATKSTPSTT